MHSEASLILPVHLPHIAIDIQVGAFHSLAICPSAVYVWGKADSNNLGYASEKTYESDPKQLKIEVREAAGGVAHSFAWKDNEVYCWGSNANYQLGLEEGASMEAIKSEIFSEAFEAGLKLRQISCGESHSIAIFEQEGPESCIFAWGNGKNHQLGLETNFIVPYPVLLNFRASVRWVESRSDFNVLVTAEGGCYSWGSNLFGRLGLPNSIKNNKSPTQILNLPPISKISLGKYHCVAIDQKGTGYSWGHGMHGQLALNKIVSEIGPTRIELPEPIVQVACGEYHTLVLTASALYSCGNNTSGALGHNDVDQRKRCKALSPIKLDVKSEEIKKIKSGDKHNLLLLTSGKVLAWGCNKYGQLGQPESQSEADSRSFISKMKIKESYSIEEDNGKTENPKQKQLMDWKTRFSIFKREQAAKEQEFMEELERIMALSNEPSAMKGRQG